MLSQSSRPEAGIGSSTDQGNLLRGIVIWSDAAQSVVQGLKKGLKSNWTTLYIHKILIQRNFKNLQYKNFMQL